MVVSRAGTKVAVLVEKWVCSKVVYSAEKMVDQMVVSKVDYLEFLMVALLAERKGL